MGEWKGAFMHINRTLRSAALVLAAAGCHLAASDLQWGATAGLGAPAQDLKDGVDNRSGMTLGAQATIHLGAGQAIRPRLDVARFRSGWYDEVGLQARDTVDTLKLGADFIYHVTGEDHGPYVFAGLGGVASRHTLDVTGAGISGFSEAETVNTAYYQMGAGYQISRNWGVEAYHTRHKFSRDMIYSATFLAVTARF